MNWKIWRRPGPNLVGVTSFEDLQKQYASGRRPRWLAKLQADVGGYFWLPCPICGENFGGQEVGPAALMDSTSHGKCVCNKPACEAEARRQSKPWYELANQQLAAWRKERESPTRGDLA